MKPPTEQLRDGVALPLLGLGRLSGRGWRWLALYLFLGTGVLAALGLWLSASEGELRHLLFGYLLPPELEVGADLLTRLVLRAQTRQVLANALVAGSLVAVSLLLFGVKERLSRAVEEDSDLLDGRAYEEPPLWREALEEVKLAALYLAAFFLLFWLGHGPQAWRGALAGALSTLFVFFTYAVDFGAPLMMRHRARYSQIIGATLRRPITSFAFGAAFALPALITAQLASATPSLGAGGSLALVFGVNMATLGAAAVGGTWLGARLLPIAEVTPPAGPWLRAAGWGALLAILALGVTVTLSLAATLHTKSQLLRCGYAVDWASFEVDEPQLGGLLTGEVRVGLSFVVSIDNPNAIAVEIEENRLELRDRGGLLLAEGRLSPLTVPPRGATTTRVALEARVVARALLEGASLDPRGWRLTLYLRVADGLDYPIYLKRAR